MRLLIVDDDKIHRTIYASIVQKMNYEVDVAPSPSEADVALRRTHYDAVILDLMLGTESGNHVLALMSALQDKPRVLLVTGAPDKVIEETFAIGRALGLELYGPVKKPVNITLICTLLRGMEIAALNESRELWPAVTA